MNLQVESQTPQIFGNYSVLGMKYPPDVAIVIRHLEYVAIFSGLDMKYPDGSPGQALWREPDDSSGLDSCGALGSTYLGCVVAYAFTFFWFLGSYYVKPKREHTFCPRAYSTA